MYTWLIIKAQGTPNSQVRSVQRERQRTYFWTAGGGAQHTWGPPGNRLGLRRIHYHTLSVHLGLVTIMANRMGISYPL